MQARKKRVQQLKNYALGAASLEGASPEVGQATLTVGQIVDRLGPLAPDSSTVSERIRHWTREGLLIPVSQYHAGTGKHRGYDASSTFTAAVLNALTTAGLQVVSRPYIQAALRETRLALQKWQQAKSAGRKLPLFFLVIVHDTTRSGGEPSVRLREGIRNYDPTAKLAIVINLSELFRRVRPAALNVNAEQNEKLADD